jgi:hypothetical protein
MMKMNEVEIAVLTGASMVLITGVMLLAGAVLLASAMVP